MTWSNRLRLALGIVFVLALSALLTFHLNKEKGLATSTSASITSESYTVASPYAGLVTEQFVQDGDTVAAGDPLFIIDSQALRNELALDMEPSSTTASVINKDGTLVITAAAAGSVTDISAQTGTYTQGAAPLAEIDKAGTLKVEADFTLSPTEYARVEDGAAVTIVLPNQKTLSGKVETVDVETKNGQAEAVITVVSDQLTLGSENGLVAAGTPITAELHLRNDGVVSSIAAKVQGFFREVF